MATWNAQTYLKFSGERLRPALDLMAQIPLEAPQTIIDLGCGPGNVTHILSERWAGADISGVDSSSNMLEKAAVTYPSLTWKQEDVATWQADVAPDILYSNACLHWLDDHETLFPKLLKQVKPQGVLAVQMPNNFAAMTHQAIRDVLGENHPLSPKYPVHEARDYYDWLNNECTSLNIWETTYMHILEGENPIADWTKGAALRPVLDGLSDEAERAEFEAKYRALILDAYPKSANGKTVLPFKRLFMVAVRG